MLTSFKNELSIQRVRANALTLFFILFAKSDYSDFLMLRVLYS
nr:MAG TPA: hypothetical protein [Caudoviricetes sp.]DAU89569.1 MAG TPA: hypothetical protein [Caudoviricetes sp.]